MLASTSKNIQNVTPPVPIQNHILFSSDSDSDTNEVALGIANSDRRKRHFNEKWLKEFVFIEKKNGAPFCVCCAKSLSMNKTHLQRHKDSKIHNLRWRAFKMQPAAVTDTDTQKEIAFQQRLVKIGELKTIMFLLERNLPFMLIKPLIQLIKSVAMDSSVAKHFKCGKTKATAVTKTIMRTEGRDEIIKTISFQPFSIIIDETTDVSTKKCLVIVIRYFDFSISRVKDKFLTLLEVEHVDAKALFEVLKTFFTSLNIDMKNIIGFAADNASVMMGTKGGVKSFLLNENPYLYVMGCVCHSMHLCASAAAKKIPANVENLARNVYLFLAHSAKRQSEFKEFQELFSDNTNKILKMSATRWLSLENVINRVLENWSALKHFFIVYELDRSADMAKNIYSELNTSNKIYFSFLSYVLKLTNKINLEFQSETARIHILLSEVKDSVKTILANFIKIDCITDDLLKTFQILNKNIFCSVDEIYIGPAAEKVICSYELDEISVREIRKSCRMYYIELVTQILNRIKIDDDVLIALEILNPIKLGRSLIPLLTKFPNLIGEDVSEGDIELEWRHLILQSTISKTLPLEDFWCQVFEHKNALNENMYPGLKKFIGSMLSFPHSSASAELIFSNLNLIKNKQRNCLSIDTVDAIMVSKQMLSDLHASDWQPSEKLLKKYS